MPPRPLLIGTRGSPLALWQARHVWALLLEAHGLGEGDVGLSVITTSGDRIKDAPLRDFGGKGLFTKEIDEALLRGDVDLAVHSMKDLPTFLPENIVHRRGAAARRRARRLHQRRRRLPLPSCRPARWSAPRRCGAARR